MKKPKSILSILLLIGLSSCAPDNNGANSFGGYFQPYPQRFLSSNESIKAFESEFVYASVNKGSALPSNLESLGEEYGYLGAAAGYDIVARSVDQPGKGQYRFSLGGCSFWGEGDETFPLVGAFQPGKEARDPVFIGDLYSRGILSDEDMKRIQYSWFSFLLSKGSPLTEANFLSWKSLIASRWKQVYFGQYCSWFDYHVLANSRFLNKDIVTANDIRYSSFEEEAPAWLRGKHCNIGESEFVYLGHFHGYHAYLSGKAEPSKQNSVEYERIKGETASARFYFGGRESEFRIEKENSSSSERAVCDLEETLGIMIGEDYLFSESEIMEFACRYYSLSFDAARKDDPTREETEFRAEYAKKWNEHYRNPGKPVLYSDKEVLA